MSEPTTPLSTPVQNAVDFLRRVGLSTSVIVTEHSDLVIYPGGAYMNRYVRFERGEKHMDAMTDLLAGWPSIAILDLQQAGLWN